MADLAKGMASVALAAVAWVMLMHTGEAVVAGMVMVLGLAVVWGS